MNTPKKKSPRKRKEDDFENIIYTEEEAEMLGFSSTNPKAENDDEEDEDLFEIKDEEDDEEEEEIEVKPTYAKKKADKEKFYVNPQEFDEEIAVYYKTGNMSDNLALMVSKIANKLSYAPNFINYTFREEMVGDGIIRMFKALTSQKYDREKGSNPFSYFTRVAFNAFRNRIKKEKHLRDTHEKYQENLLLFSENYNTIVKNNQLRIQKDRDVY